MGRELKKHQLVERSITKKYRHELWNQFVQGVKDYSLVEEGDTICVVLDGTAQSVLIAKLLQHLKRISQTPFEIVCKGEDKYGELDIHATPNPTGYNKITSTECMSDVNEQTLHNMLSQGKIASILPKEQDIIRPLFCIKREDVMAFVRYNELEYPVAMSTVPETAQLIAELEKKDNGIEHSMFRSIHSLSLDTMIGYSKDGEYHSFLEKY